MEQVSCAYAEAGGKPCRRMVCRAFSKVKCSIPRYFGQALNGPEAAVMHRVRMTGGRQLPCFTPKPEQIVRGHGEV
jgi:hypothetical protein